MGRVSAAMKKDNLLSIGALSKQTGVHIKSLRYYDSLGILRPAYVDPSSGYRYYNLQQIPVVGAIKLCIDLGIPSSISRSITVRAAVSFAMPG